ncbi:TniQ family protein [Ralstonia chuxiongensis]|uniref:TniQ family protein n=1 Tax=Ralstonia chuxiongensis TaxID=2957504 RepID=UPI0028F60E7C|nr:hypothetical protein R8510_04774 [Ralstonia chuxiongensis]
MSLPWQRHPGLPVVPPAVVGELLGSWLLRVAQVYGMGLRELLVRLAALRPANRVSVPWYKLHQGHLAIDPLASALHRTAESVATMSAPLCDRRWPAELGYCGQCLDEAASVGAPSPWLRRWLHPLALACEKHRTWLEPVTTKHLREIRRVSDIAGLPRKTAHWSALQRRRESALIAGALWLETLVTDPQEHHPPWGKTDVGQLAKILSSLIHLMMSPAAADMVRHQLGRGSLPDRRQRWACQTFRVDDGLNGIVSLAAPDHLRHRQFVFGLLGCYLRFAPADRAPLKKFTSLIATEIPIWQLARWSPGAARWIAPTSNSSFGPRPKSSLRTNSARPRKPTPPVGS